MTFGKTLQQDKVLCSKYYGRSGNAYFCNMKKSRQILFEKLRKKNAFWSYKNVNEIDDDLLIEKVLLMLDLDDINLLFKIYDKGFLKQVWEERILRQEPYFHGLNRFFAWFYFGIKDPDEYISNRKIYIKN